MFHSNKFGRIFWIDNNNDFRSCPQYVDGTGDFANADYVSEWDDWEGVNYNELFKIQRACVINKRDYAGSLSLNDH